MSIKKTVLSESDHDFLGTPVHLTISTEFSVRDVEIKQKSPTPLQPFSIDYISGYKSPSGGYVNFATYEVKGINKTSGRSNKKKYECFNEEDARTLAESDGLTEPFQIRTIPNKAPTDRQLEYAASLGITIPDGACFYDVSALISRVCDDDEAIAREWNINSAIKCNLKFSRYAGSKALLNMVSDYRTTQFRLKKTK